MTLDIRWGADDAVLDAILDLARAHQLGLCDPQGPDIHCPPWTADDAQPVPPPRSLGEYARILGVGAFGVLLVLGGWAVSIPVLSWLVIAAGAFVTILALLFLVLAIRHSLFGTSPA